MGILPLSYQSVDDMARVRVMMGCSSLGADKVHHLVFAFPRNAAIGKNNLEIHPSRILVQFLGDPEPERFTQVGHEGCSGSNAVGVKLLLSVMIRTLSFQFS